MAYLWNWRQGDGWVICGSLVSRWFHGWVICGTGDKMMDGSLFVEVGVESSNFQ